MTLKSIIENERKGIEKMRKYQLPNGFKKIGSWIFIFSFVSIFVVAFIPDASEFKELLQQACKFGMIVGLLLISISKEKIEDELIIQLRMQSFTFAFICAVFYALILPFVNYFFDLITSGNSGIQGVGDFSILWMLLIVQVAYFKLLKHLHNEK